MNYITTTELRTETPCLIEALLMGENVDLIHRSKIIATMKPKKNEPKPLTEEDIEKMTKLAKSISFPKLSDKVIKRLYSKHITQKYGKGLS